MRFIVITHTLTDLNNEPCGEHIETFNINTDKQIRAARRALAAHGIKSAKIYVGHPDSPDSYANGQVLDAVQYQLQVRLGGTWEFPGSRSDATFATTEEAEAAWDSLVESDAAWGEREHRIVEA